MVASSAPVRAGSAPLTQDAEHAALTQAWVNDVEAAAGAGRWDQALALAERALELGFQHGRLYLLRAHGHRRAGRRTAALADLEQALALAPEDPGVLQPLAAEIVDGQPRRAVELLQRAISVSPEVVELFAQLGTAHLRAGDMQGAEVAFERAVALQPGLAAAWGRLAVLASNRGQPELARRRADRALALDPYDPDGRRAAIESDLDLGRWEAAERAARTSLNTGRLGPTARSHALGLLGDALDGQGRYIEATTAYAQAKSAFSSICSNNVRNVRLPKLWETFSNIEKEFVSEIDRATAGSGSRATSSAAVQTPAKVHVFLMGFMRSGTTLLEQALSLSRAVTVLEETEALAEAGARHIGEPGGLGRIMEASPETLDQWRNAYWAAVETAGVDPRGAVFIDKLPFNGLKLPLIAKLFPDARIVFAIRDPRDVVLSCYQRRLQPNAYTCSMTTLEGAARLYDSYMRMAFTFRAGLPLTVMDHRHEDMVADIGSAVRRVCDFVGIDFDPEMTDPARAVRSGSVASQSARQIGRGLNASGLARWRRYRDSIRPVEPILEPWISRFGYEAD